MKPHRLSYSPMSNTPTPTMSLSIRDQSKLSNDVMNDSLKIESILKDIHLEKYIDQFNREEIDLYVFSVLNADDLIELSIDEKDRPIMLDAIKTYSNVFNESMQMSFNWLNLGFGFYNSIDFWLIHLIFLFYFIDDLIWLIFQC